MNAVKLSYQLDLEPESVWLTVTPTQAVKASIPYVQEVGDFYARAGYYTRREGLNSYLLKYTVAGEGELDYNGNTYPVLPGQMFWIDCRKPQFYRPSPRVGHWHMLWAHFYGNSCREYYELFETQTGGSCSVTLSPKAEGGSTLRQLVNLFQTRESSFSTDVYAASLINSLMTQCILGTGTPLDFSTIPEYVRDARAYLMDNYASRITLDDLARRYSVNKFYFQKQFKRFIGYTPNAFVTAARLNRAKELLRTTDRTIAQIASDVGLDNVSHFINTFKEHEGLTPYSFRQNWYG
jgi:AraC-like DNA-binding protein